MPNSTTEPNDRVRCKRAMSDYSEFIRFMAEPSSAQVTGVALLFFGVCPVNRGAPKRSQPSAAPNGRVGAAEGCDLLIFSCWESTTPATRQRARQSPQATSAADHPDTDNPVAPPSTDSGPAQPQTAPPHARLRTTVCPADPPAHCRRQTTTRHRPP